MKPDIKKKWLEALRSGEYKQGKQYLQMNSKFCCLGILCDIHAKETGGMWAPWETNGIMDYLTHVSTLPKEITEWAGIRDMGEYGGTFSFFLVQDNDNGKTFLEIADIIEKHF